MNVVNSRASNLFRRSFVSPAVQGLLQSSIQHGLPRFHSDQSGSSETDKQKLKKPNTPTGKLDEASEDLAEHPHAEKEPLPPWPNGVNPHTGEKGGPRGPEPTRYGDWERKGRVSDF